MICVLIGHTMLQAYFVSQGGARQWAKWLAREWAIQFAIFAEIRCASCKPRDLRHRPCSLLLPTRDVALNLHRD